MQKSVAMQLNEYTPLHVACLHSSIEVYYVKLDVILGEDYIYLDLSSNLLIYLSNLN